MGPFFRTRCRPSRWSTVTTDTGGFMARKHRHIKTRRDVPQSSLTPSALPENFTAIRSNFLFEDRRIFNPEPTVARTPRRVVRLQLPKVPRLVARQATRSPIRRSRNGYVRSAPSPHGYALLKSGRHRGLVFSVPEAVPICVRRKRRREVLLALGKGGGGKRRPRYNKFSNVRC
ncbi:hypothetical protein [Apis mellifera associated microvirus 45]|nr:hypothetical protein [Apis mellifera associated microvirus 45]